MAHPINVFGDFGRTVFGLAPRASQTWISFGGAFGDYARIFSFAAVPLGGPPGEKILEVTDVEYEVGNDGNRRVFFTVRNMTDLPADYQIVYTFTDII